jgi:hypothetical protein
MPDGTGSHTQAWQTVSPLAAVHDAQAMIAELVAGRSREAAEIAG